ncbi:hypothetical protein ACTFIW_011382 [Dictyostelium discoideum]
MIKNNNNNNTYIEINGGGEIDFILDKLSLNLRLVSHEWNNYISIDNITNIFKINNNNKSIIKTLKINYSKLKGCFYFGENTFELMPVKLHYVDDLINQLNKFKQQHNNEKINNLVIRNVPLLSYYRPPMYHLSSTPPEEMMVNLRNHFKKIHLYQYEFNDNTYMEIDISSPSSIDLIDKLFSIKIKGERYKDNFKNIASTLQHYNKSIKMIETDISQSKSISYPIIEILSTIDSSLISNIEHIKTSGITTFNELKICLNEIPKLKTISINFCFYKLLYFLNDDNGDNGDDNLCCNCYSFGDFKEKSKYKKQWYEILNLLKLNETIKSLEIGHLCINKTGIFQNNLDKHLQINNSFINNFSLLISSINSLEKLSINNILLPSTIFENVLSNNKLISEFQITTFFYPPILKDFSNLISLFELILSNNNNNNNIKKCKIINIQKEIGYLKEYEEKVIFNKYKF